MQPLPAQQKGGEDETGPYEVVSNWPQPLHNDGWTWGSTAAVWAGSPDRVFVFQRGELEELKDPLGSGGLPKRAATSGKPRSEHCLLVFDRNGKLVPKPGAERANLLGQTVHSLTR